MKRIPEPELMDDPAQAHAYARADFNAPNSLFLQLFTEKFPHFSPLSVLDLGCGPADIAIRFARRFPEARVTGLDGASHMLDHGKRAIAACGFQKRVTLCKGVLPLSFLPGMDYEAIIANSLLHHLADPQVMWRAIREAGRGGTAVLVMDLKRPSSRGAAEKIVQVYAGNESPLLQKDFYNSLLAAYQPMEVQEQLARAGLPCLRIEEVSDRHLAVWGRLVGASSIRPSGTRGLVA